MKTAHGRVLPAKTRVQEVSGGDVVQAIRDAGVLLGMGYLWVQSIAGGIDAWVAGGGPVAQPRLPSSE